MKNCLRKNFLIIFLTGLFIAAIPARGWAQAVVSDTQSTGKTVKQWFTEVKESKTVVGTMNTVKKTSAAIGTAKKSVSEYVLENKEKIEAKLAKVKEYKEKAEEYKAEYDKYKKQLDENIAKAKELKEQAETGIETAKETAAAAKEAAGAAVDAAKDKAGIGGKDDSAGTAETTESADEDTPSAAVGSETATTSSANNAEKGLTTDAASALTNGAVMQESSRKAFGTGETETSSSATEGTAAVEYDAAARVLTPSELETYGTLQGKSNLSAAERQTFDTLKEKISATRLQKADNKAVSTSAGNTAGTVSGLPSVTAVKTVSPAVVSADMAVTSRPTAAETLSSSGTAIQKAVTVPQVVPAEKTRLRKAFTTSSLHHKETLAFAKVEMLNLPDGGTDSNGAVIIPQALAMYCGLSSGDALESGALDECLLKLNKERKSAQLFSGSDAPKMYNRALAQYVAASIAEAYKARQDAESFEENFIDAVDFAPEPTAQDVYDNIVELNKAIDMQMNGLLKIFSTQLASQALYNYGRYAFVPAEEDAAEGDSRETAAEPAAGGGNG